MNISMNWLKSFVDIDVSPREFSHAMTMTGSKVEGYTALGEEISKVVVGRVLEVALHENSDHLHICKVDVGGQAPLQIITGAKNVVPGALVPVALDGATLPGGKTIKTGKLRGELSEGMLCSLGELGLTVNDFPYAIEDGIFLIEEEDQAQPDGAGTENSFSKDISCASRIQAQPDGAGTESSFFKDISCANRVQAQPDGAGIESSFSKDISCANWVQAQPGQPGEDIRTAIGLDDVCVEFEITPNRPDCLSMIGIARETSITYQLPLKLKKPEVKGCAGTGNIAEHVSATVQNTELCRRYCAKMVQNVRIAPSPLWMRQRLRACGVRPINNLVDITNYVMLEYGQPLHAFDLQHLEGGKIIVRNANSGETIHTLDGTLRNLTPEMLVIADEKKPVAIAGIMGGENSGILDTTKTVIFESANFYGHCVRMTSKALGLRTDSSSKFEKGLDPKNTMDALLRACELVEQLQAGEVADGVIDLDYSQTEPVRIKLDADWINELLGVSIPAEEMKEMLRLAFFVAEGEDVIVPSFRTDVTHKADLAEEIARIYGYDKIPLTMISGKAEGKLSPEQRFERTVHQTMRALGCYEVTTYSFISPKYFDKINLPADSALRNAVVIRNPLGEDTGVMRTTALPSMLEVLSKNYNNRNERFAGYELATEYQSKGAQELPEETSHLVIGLYGKQEDFYSLKGMAETLLSQLNIKGWDIEPVHEGGVFHPGRCARITLNGEFLGILGEVHPAVLSNYDIDQRAYLAKFDFLALFRGQSGVAVYQPLPKYPATSRDLSLICEESLPVITIEKAIRRAAGEVLETLTLFDVYQGTQIAEGQKSVSYSMLLRSDAGTLTDAQADEAMKRVLQELEKINVVLRG